MDAPKTKILIVEDFYTTRNVIIYILRQTGFKLVECVANRQQAMSRLGSGEFGIVISDWNAVIDGLELLNTLRASPQFKDIVFIMVTSETNRDKVMEAKESGVDGYVMKPFTAEALCKRIVDSIKAKYKDIYQEAQLVAKQKQAQSRKDPAMKVFGAAGKKTGFSARNWSLTPSYLSSKPRETVIGGNIAAMMEILSPQFDMMREQSVFVPVSEMIGKIETTVKSAEKQTENAGRIAVAAENATQALDLLDAPVGSSEAMQGLKAINESAVKISDMIDAFDKDVEGVLKMLDGMEGMVRQAHIHEINESIRASCELETQPEPGTAIAAGDESGAKAIAERLSRIRTESESSREKLATAADGIAKVVEKLDATKLPADSPREMFRALGDRIENMLNVLDSQIAKTETLAQGMEDVAAVKNDVANIDPEKDDEREKDEAEHKPEEAEAHPADKSARNPGASFAFRKIIEYRSLMIDIVSKDLHLSVRNLEDILGGRVEVRREHLPGHPESSLSKWLDRRTEHKDFYDINVCNRIADIRDEMYREAEKVVGLHKKGEKTAARKGAEGIGEKARIIDMLLGRLQNELKGKLE
ncbi:MAG TPA: response regulator [Dissulfurispiraceae bacterium]